MSKSNGGMVVRYRSQLLGVTAAAAASIAVITAAANAAVLTAAAAAANAAVVTGLPYTTGEADSGKYTAFQAIIGRYCTR